MSREEFLAVTWALSDLNVARDAMREQERAAACLPRETHTERLLRAATAAEASMAWRGKKIDIPEQ
ncbi:hypothetical protein HFN89_00835 [Rhizobium laguerreae]|nr:hypothetical protein [Rhizobium laguerreae]